MASRVRVTFEPSPGGESQLAASLAIQDHMERVGAAVVSVADRLTPVDTGFLRLNNDYIVETSGPVVRTVVFNDAEYAGFVHNGTRFMNGRPWLEVAAETVTGKPVI